MVVLLLFNLKLFLTFSTLEATKSNKNLKYICNRVWNLRALSHPKIDLTMVFWSNHLTNAYMRSYKTWKNHNQVSHIINSIKRTKVPERIEGNERAITRGSKQGRGKRLRFRKILPREHLNGLGGMCDNDLQLICTEERWGIDPFPILKIAHCNSDYNRTRFARKRVAPMAWKQFHPLSSGQSSRSVVSDSLRPHGLQRTRPPCPSPPPRVYSDSCPLSRWCHPTISSSVVPSSSSLTPHQSSHTYLLQNR